MAHPEDSTTAAPVLGEADERGREGGRTAREHNVCGVPALPQDDTEGSRGGHVQRETHSLREAAPELELDRGHDLGDHALSQGDAPMVPGSPAPGREQSAVEGDIMARACFVRDQKNVLDVAQAMRFTQQSRVRSRPDHEQVSVGIRSPQEDIRIKDGKLDPIPEGLAGRVDLSDRSLHPEYPLGSPMGRAQRLLFSECPKEFMIRNPLSVEFRSSNKDHLRHVHDLLEAGIAEKKTSKERESVASPSFLQS